MTTAQQRGTQSSPTAGGPAYSWSPSRQLRQRPPPRCLPHQLGPAPTGLPIEAARTRRPTRIAGVCAGPGLHLDIPARYIRAFMVVFALGGDAGVLLYALLWATLPGENGPAGEAPASVVSRARLAARLRSRRGTAEPWINDGAPLGLSQTVLNGGALPLVALFLASWRFGLLNRIGAVGVIIVIIAGAALAWSQMDNLVGPDHNLSVVLWVAGGVCLAVVGILVWMTADNTPYKLISGFPTRGVLVAGIDVVLAPLWLRTNRALADAHTAEIREVRRADIATHLHDPALQTLTLIHRHADESEAVTRPARSRECELQAWLYADRPVPGTSVADAFTDLAGETEDHYGVAIGTVCADDRAPDRDTEVIIATAREALFDAVHHGAPPISPYIGAGEENLEVFVRDHGPSFDLNVIAGGRHDMRQSIITRMECHDDSARVRRMSTDAEVALTLPVRAP